ncbi:hypothetical protein RB600_010152 [Gaeumannomyces tritici]
MEPLKPMLSAGPARSWPRRHKRTLFAMAFAALAALVIGLAVGLTRSATGPVTAVPGAAIATNRGQAAVIGSWSLQSTAQAGNDMAKLSRAGADVSTWHRIAISKCTLMACLMHKGMFDDKVFYSENLKKVDASQFRVPWVYRHEFTLNSAPSTHYFLETNGISSRADVWLNGQQLASKDQHAGSYVGMRLDISKYAAAHNVLAIRVYPTNYNYDFALGFVDWNPYPADNGTGVWRDVTLRQTGPVAVSDFRAATSMADLSSANVTLKATVVNLENRPVTINVRGRISGNSEYAAGEQNSQQTLELAPLRSREIALTIAVDRPQIWWPKLWGAQPLYSGRLDVVVNGTLSDAAERQFGIRTVTSQVNSHNDTIFSVNGQPFQVVGGGYSADMFLRWDPARFEAQARYMLDLGHNTVRLEGKQEHPELYDMADRLGLMVIAGWECCDKWEAWSYNNDLAIQPPPVYSDADYAIAAASMRHEALMMQSHPSMLAFLVGSDYWPDDRATQLYVDALRAADWNLPVVASASKRGYPQLLGPSGMKMDGPYDWVPPNYWYDTEGAEDRKGAAFGFGSELGAGVGTPELGSLRKFLSSSDMVDLWRAPNKGLYHMSNEGSQFFTRQIYNEALFERFGPPNTSAGSPLDDYLLKAQMMDYEATRAQFEGFAARWNAARPATGLIYWMLNNAWPSLHWNLFDYYLRPAGSYFGAKMGARTEHVAYDYVQRAFYMINRSLDRRGQRTIEAQFMSLDGRVLSTQRATGETEPNTSKRIPTAMSAVPSDGVILLRLVLSDGNATLSRNVYWLSRTTDSLDWANSTWYHTPVTNFADFTALNAMQSATVSVTVSGRRITLENKSTVPAVFVRLNLVDERGADVVPVFWSDNYVTLWPGEKMDLDMEGKGRAIEISGKNVAAATIRFQ